MGSIECPGGYATPCSNRGRCVGSVAPIEPWEAEDGSVNETFVEQGDLADTRQEDEVSCVCDEGFVGSSCQHVCPGYGQCEEIEGGSGAVCQCFDSVERYGDACEF